MVLELFIIYRNVYCSPNTNAQNIKIQKEFASKFNKVNEQNYWLPITSGTIEMQDNKVIVLAD